MPSASGRPEPPAEPRLVLESPRCARRFPGLGRWLGVAALLAFLVPFSVGALAGVLHALTHIAVLDQVRAIAFDLIGIGMLAALGGAALGAALTSAPIGAPGAAHLMASPAGLQITQRSARWIPRARIEDGLIVPGFPPRAQIRLTGGEVLDVDVPSEAEGVALLSALALGARQRRAVVLLGSPNQQIAAGCAALPMSMITWSTVLILFFDQLKSGTLGGALWSIAVLLTVIVARRAFRPTEVVVGRDGVRVERAFTRRWIPYAALESIELDRDALRLRRRDAGRAVVLRSTPDVLEGLARRIREAQTLGAAGAARAAVALERQGRPLAAWRDALRGLLAAEGGYRAAAITPEDVLDALEDPQAPRDRRIGAALALAAAGHPEARARIRIAADASADEDLRAALEQAAEGEVEEAALSRALR